MCLARLISFGIKLTWIPQPFFFLTTRPFWWVSFFVEDAMFWFSNIRYKASFRLFKFCGKALWWSYERFTSKLCLVKSGNKLLPAIRSIDQHLITHLDKINVSLTAQTVCLTWHICVYTVFFTSMNIQY